MKANMPAAIRTGYATYADDDDEVGFAAARGELVLPPFLNCLGNVGNGLTIFGRDVRICRFTLVDERLNVDKLKYSRWIRVSVVKDQTVEKLVRNLAEHLESWGGAPLMCVFDRPKTYLRPIAKILLALAARREKQDIVAQTLFEN